MLSSIFHTFTQNNFLWKNRSSCSLLQTMCGFLALQIQDELEKQCEKKCFCQAVVPSFISESENSRKQKTIRLQLLLCGKRKKKTKSEMKDCGEIPAELPVLKTRCRGPRPQLQDKQKMVMAWHGPLNCKTWWIFFPITQTTIWWHVSGVERATKGGDFGQSHFIYLSF